LKELKKPLNLNYAAALARSRKNGFLEPSSQVKSRQVSSFLAKLFRGRQDSTNFAERIIFLKNFDISTPQSLDTSGTEVEVTDLARPTFFP
jgi:hypothetical protein